MQLTRVFLREKIVIAYVRTYGRKTPVLHLRYIHMKDVKNHCSIACISVLLLEKDVGKRQHKTTALRW